MLARLVAGGGPVCVRRLGGTRAGEMRITRFLRNRKVTVAEMLATAAVATAARAAGRPVLAIQDTTSLRDDGAGCSLNLHAMLAVDAVTGAVLGLVAGQVLTHAGGQAAGRRRRPHAEKESHRWHAAACAAGERLATAAAVTVVADREGDIYEDFALRPAGVALLVRAAQDRAIAGGGTLFGCLDGQPELGRCQVDLAAAPGRPARTATLALRVRPVSLRRPTRHTGHAAAALPPTVDMTLVEAREVDPPPGTPAAHWRLLTSQAVPDLAAARQVCACYRARWTIEQLFRTLKTRGFDVEALRIADDQPFQALATAALIAATQVLQMVQARDGAGQHPLTHAFDAGDQGDLETISRSLEGKTERQKNPHPPGSLAFATWVCARLGGWTGYYGKPGPIVLYHGLRQLRAIQSGLLLGRLL